MPSYESRAEVNDFTALGAYLDFVLAILPVMIIKHLNMDTKKRVVSCALLALSLV